MLPLGQRLLSLSLLGISIHCCTVNDCFGPWSECGCPQKQPELKTTAWRYSVTKIVCSVAQLCPTPVSEAKAHGQGRARAVSALGMVELALALPWLQRDRNLPQKQGSLGKGSHIWGRTEMLMKPLCWDSKECLGKQWIEPASTKCKHRKVI